MGGKGHCPSEVKSRTSAKQGRGGSHLTSQQHRCFGGRVGQKEKGERGMLPGSKHMEKVLV